MKFAWHVHHDILGERLTHPIEERQKHIKEHKPKKEIETRLRLLKHIKDELPPTLISALENMKKAEKTFNVAHKALQEVFNDTHEEIKALHEKECPDCPWDGETIFPENYWIDIGLLLFAASLLFTFGSSVLWLVFVPPGPVDIGRVMCCIIFTSASFACGGTATKQAWGFWKKQRRKK